MKKLSVLCAGMCAVLALASCGTSKESAYKKAYEKAQQQEQAPVAQEAQIVFNSSRNMYRVVAATFADKSGAVKSRNQLRAGKYPDAWLLLKK